MLKSITESLAPPSVHIVYWIQNYIYMFYEYSFKVIKRHFRTSNTNNNVFSSHKCILAVQIVAWSVFCEIIMHLTQICFPFHGFIF